MKVKAIHLIDVRRLVLALTLGLAPIVALASDIAQF